MTLTGLGDLKDLLSPDIGVKTHIGDVLLTLASRYLT